MKANIKTQLDRELVLTTVIEPDKRGKYVLILPKRWCENKKGKKAEVIVRVVEGD